MSERTWQLRAMSVAELLDETIRLYRHNFLTFVGIVAILQIPITVVTTVLPFLGIATGALIASLLENLVVNNLITAALAQAISHRYLDEPISIGGAYRSILGRFWSLLGVLILLVLINVGPALLLFIPIIGALAWIVLAAWINIRLVFITQAIVLEEERARDGISRSWDLVKGHWWRTLGIFLLLFLFSLLLVTGPTYAVALGLEALEISFELQALVMAVLSAVLTILFKPIQLTGMTLLYYDLRIRKEGLDLELQAEALGEGLDIVDRIVLPFEDSPPPSIETTPPLAEQAEADLEDPTALGDDDKLRRAIQSYWVAIAQRPDDASLHNSLGLALHQLGNLDAALRELRQAVELEPDSARFHLNLARVEHDRGDLDAARQALQTYLELETDPEARVLVEGHPDLASLLKIEGGGTES